MRQVKIFFGCDMCYLQAQVNAFLRVNVNRNPVSSAIAVDRCGCYMSVEYDS